MNKPALKKLLLLLFLTLSGLISSTAYAWPEVDHMNMCGAATKVSQKYAGNFKGWVARDNYVNKMRRVGYYYRTNCPKIAAPVKKKSYKKTTKKFKRSTIVKMLKSKRIARSSKAKAFKRKVKYDKHADCVRVDKMNHSGAAVRVIRKR